MIENTYLDIHGVLANFVKGVSEVHQKPYEPESVTQYHMPKLWGMTEEEFTRPIRENRLFWSDLEVYPWAVELFDRCLVRSKQLHILTSPLKRKDGSVDSGFLLGTIDFLVDHFDMVGVRLLLDADKSVYANKRSLLIDDYRSNVDAFRKNGGHAILIRHPWNQ